jgi:hypothetical protein
VGALSHMEASKLNVRHSIAIAIRVDPAILECSRADRTFRTASISDDIVPAGEISAWALS